MTSGSQPTMHRTNNPRIPRKTRRRNERISRIRKRVAPTNAVADLPKLPHRASPSGLAVSGTIRFTPPPNSSPTFDGKPRLIRGYIAVGSYVQGDGTLVLDEAPFAVKHN